MRAGSDRENVERKKEDTRIRGRGKNVRRELRHYSPELSFELADLGLEEDDAGVGVGRHELFLRY